MHEDNGEPLFRLLTFYILKRKWVEWEVYITVNLPSKNRTGGFPHIRLKRQARLSTRLLCIRWTSRVAQ